MEPEGEQGAHRTGSDRGDRGTGYDDYGQALAPNAPSTPSLSATEIADEVLEDDDQQPTVEHRAWLKKDDYWRRTTYIAVTGRHTAALPRTRRLPPPRRFRNPRPVRSGLVLALVIALIVLIPFGIVAMQRQVANIHLPSNIPGVTVPTPSHTPTPTVTVKPTSTPKKK